MTDRVSGAAVDGSTITFTGVQTFRGSVSQGRFEVNLSAGQYAVTIEGPSHIPHRTEIVQVSAGQDYDFTVLGTGGEIRAGLVRVNVFRPGDQRLHTRNELKGIILHEFYHVALSGTRSSKSAAEVV